MTFQAIRAGKVVVRLKLLEDAPNDYAWRCDEELSALDAATPLQQPYQEFLYYYKESLRTPTPWSERFAIDTADGKHIGNCMCYDINVDYGEAEVGIMIGDKGYWSEGYGYHSMVALVDHMFTTTSLRRLYLHTLDWNHRAQRSFQKCGFTPVRTTRRFGHTMIRMELSRDQWFQVRRDKLVDLSRAQEASSLPSPPSPSG